MWFNLRPQRGIYVGCKLLVYSYALIIALIPVIVFTIRNTRNGQGSTRKKLIGTQRENTINIILIPILVLLIHVYGTILLYAIVFCWAFKL